MGESVFFGWLEDRLGWARPGHLTRVCKATSRCLGPQPGPCRFVDSHALPGVALSEFKLCLSCAKRWTLLTPPSYQTGTSRWISASRSRGPNGIFPHARFCAIIRPPCC